MQETKKENSREQNLWVPMPAMPAKIKGQTPGRSFSIPNRRGIMEKKRTRKDARAWTKKGLESASFRGQDESWRHGFQQMPVPGPVPSLQCFSVSLAHSHSFFTSHLVPPTHPRAVPGCVEPMVPRCQYPR
jgi:hypothetical protein